MSVAAARRLSAVGLLLLLLAPGRLCAEPRLRWMGDLRIRQEFLPNVYWFDAREDDRNWIRFRTRAGGSLQLNSTHGFELRLANEFREILEPDGGERNWDELILDRLLYRYRPEGGGLSLTVGRQDVIWDDGFLMLEGHPYDGSRSIYQNAVRLEWSGDRGTLELLGIANPKRDPIVLIDDQDRALSPADERAGALRLRSPAGRQLALIVKHEDDPDGRVADLTAWTLAGRDQRPLGPLAWTGELALQHLAREGGGDGVAFAFQTWLLRECGPGRTTALGAFCYSGRDGDLWGFHAPYGGWPRWSELYIYSLVGEEGVAAWRNIAAPWLRHQRRLHPRLGLRATAYWLLAPEPAWRTRGTLTELKLSLDLTSQLQGHLLWEWLHPGSVPAEQQDAHFLRWELSFRLP